MKCGILLRLSCPERAEEMFEWLRAEGYNCCQLVYKPEQYTEEAAAYVRRAVEKSGIEITSFFAGYRDTYTKWDLYSDFNDAGINSAAYGAARIDYLKQAAEFCGWIGVKQMLVHAGFVANNPFSTEYSTMLRLVKELAEFLKARDMELLMETGGESPITMRRLIEDVGTGNVFVNLDTANLIMYGFGNPVDAVYTLHPYIKSMHVKDGVPPQDPRKLGTETEFGAGFVDFPRLFKLLNQYGYNGPYIIEREISDAQAAQKIKETMCRVQQLVGAAENN